MGLFLGQYHTLLLAVALQYSLKSGRLILPAPFFFLKTALDIWGLLCFHMNCEIFCSSSVKTTRASLVDQMVKLQPTMWETWVQSLGREDLLEKEMATHSSILAWKIPWAEGPGRLQSMESQNQKWLSYFTSVKNAIGNLIGIALNLSEKAMAPHSSTLPWKIPWVEEPGGLQSIGLLRVGHDSLFPFTFHVHAWEKEMATHSSVLAWRIPGIGEPGGLLSMGSHRVRHDWSDLAAAAAAAALNL